MNMIGVFMALIAGFFSEIGDSIGKRSVNDHKESIYTMGFLNMFWVVVILTSSAFLVTNSFIFSLASLPTFITKMVLEIFQVYMSLSAITIASRSTFGFLRIWTLPLLLVVDIMLGYSVSGWQVGGIFILVIAFILLFINHGIEKKGSGYVIFTAINAVATISLYKYNITHYNSVLAEQLSTCIILLVYSFVMAFFVAKENPFRFFKKPRFLIQSLSGGLASIISSFAYMFAPASVITAAGRSASVFWSVLSGNVYFKESRVVLKMSAVALIGVGIFLLTQTV